VLLQAAYTYDELHARAVDSPLPIRLVAIGSALGWYHLFAPFSVAKNLHWVFVAFASSNMATSGLEMQDVDSRIHFVEESAHRATNPQEREFYRRQALDLRSERSRNVVLSSYSAVQTTPRLTAAINPGQTSPQFGSQSTSPAGSFSYTSPGSNSSFLVLDRFCVESDHADYSLRASTFAAAINASQGGPRSSSWSTSPVDLCTRATPTATPFTSIESLSGADHTANQLRAFFPTPPSLQRAERPYRVLEVRTVEGTNRTRYLLQGSDERLWHGESKKPFDYFAAFLSLDANKRTRHLWLKDQNLDGEHMSLTRREYFYPRYDEKTMTRYRGDVTADDVYIKRQKVLEKRDFTHVDNERCSLPKELLQHEIEMCELLARSSKNPHPNLARYFGVMTDRSNDVTAVVYKRYNANLAEFRAAGLFHPAHAMPFLEAIGDAVDYLRKLGYAHCWIMPENVLLSFDNKEAKAYRLTASSRSVSDQSSDSEGEISLPTELKIDAVVLGDLGATMKIADGHQDWYPKDALDNLWDWVMRPNANGKLWSVS
jgi:hypothetical protein